MSLQIKSTNSEATETLGASIGERLKGGEVVELASDLGGGKTTFTRGLVRGSGSSDHVSSPTFTVSKVYDFPKGQIHHFDFYRLDDAGLMAHELIDVLSDNTNVVVVEWASVVSEVLPAEKLTIQFTAVGENEREIVISYPESLRYLLAGQQT